MTTISRVLAASVLALAALSPAPALAATPKDDGGTIQVFDKIPQFGVYVDHEPNYTPPPGVLMWSRGTEYARMLSDADKALIGDDLTMQLTYHAQCDNYDRFGNLFFISMPKGQQPDVNTPRTTLQDFITPFSSYLEGDKATYTFPASDLGPYAAAMADPNRDIWVGIKGGSNPYPQDPCVSHGISDPDYLAVGFLYSLSLVSTAPLTATASDLVSLKSASPETTNAITAGPVAFAPASGKGTLALSIAGYGASYPSGEEYSNTTMSVMVNGVQVAQFSTQIDCASYEQYSPEGNPGIFHNNLTTNPRSWCPGALVPINYFDMGDVSGGQATVDVTFPRPAPFTPDSQYRTSLSLLAG